MCRSETTSGVASGFVQILTSLPGTFFSVYVHQIDHRLPAVLPFCTSPFAALLPSAPSDEHRSMGQTQSGAAVGFAGANNNGDAATTARAVHMESQRMIVLARNDPEVLVQLLEAELSYSRSGGGGLQADQDAEANRASDSESTASSSGSTAPLSMSAVALPLDDSAAVPASSAMTMARTEAQAAAASAPASSASSSLNQRQLPSQFLPDEFSARCAAAQAYVESEPSHSINVLNLCGNQCTLLHLAVCCSSVSLVRALLELGANPTMEVRGPLSGSDETRANRGEYVYQSRLEPHAPVKPPKMPPLPSKSPFFFGTAAGGSASRRMLGRTPPWLLRYEDHLLRGGLLPELRSRDQGFTPLMLAVIFARDESVCDIVELLLWAGARESINAATERLGWTAGMMAAQRGNIPLWNLLRSYGMDVSTARGSHGTAMQVAEVLGGRDCVRAQRLAEQQRSETLVAMEEALCGAAGMASVCAHLCAQYAGLRSPWQTSESALPLPYAWPAGEAAEAAASAEPGADAATAAPGPTAAESDASAGGPAEDCAAGSDQA
jgi:ankyrin repeat protein